VGRLSRAPFGAERTDAAAVFTAAYREFSGAVCGYLRARGVDDPEAVTQDVYLAIYPRLGELHGGMAGIRTLLFTVAHARLVDHHRSRSRSPQHVEYDPETDSRTSASAEQDALDGGMGIANVLRRLPDEYREVLALRIVADLSLETAAEIMDRSVGAVKQLQRRALLALKSELALQEGGVA
jgi:RNA polymerase sigma-70 factor (ECF subfamily)